MLVSQLPCVISFDCNKKANDFLNNVYNTVHVLQKLILYINVKRWHVSPAWKFDIMMFKALSHQVAFPQRVHGVVKIPGIAIESQENSEKCTILFYFFLQVKMSRGVLAAIVCALAEYPPSARRVRKVFTPRSRRALWADSVHRLFYLLICKYNLYNFTGNKQVHCILNFITSKKMIKTLFLYKE